MANLDPKASLPSTECNVDRQRSEKNPESPLDPKISMPSTDCDADHQRSEKTPESTSQQRKKSTATPIFAFAFIAVCLTCLIGLILVVYSSDDHSVSTWIPDAPAIQPSILISILVTLFNTFDFFIIADGLMIVWWRAFQKGSTLRTLHYIKWNGLQETWKALFVNFETRRVVLVLFVAIVIRISDGPVLQRSIKPFAADRTIEGISIWALPQTIRTGWVGQVDSTAPAGLWASGDFDDWVLKEWYTNATIRSVVACAGLCKGPVSGAGATVECSSTTHIVDLTERSSNNKSLFEIAFNRRVDDSESSVLEMRLLYTNETDSQCRATMITQYCNVRLANVTYNVISQGGEMVLDQTDYPQTLTVQPIAANASSNEGAPADALAALEYFGHYFLQSNATVRQPDVSGDYFSWEPSDVLSRQYANLLPNDEANNNSCAFRWENATDDLIWALHNVMFRMAVTSSYDNETGPAVTWTITSNGLVYQAEYVTLWVAIGSMFFGLLASMSLLWGFWQLDREVSLSPVETARALAKAVLKSPSGDLDMNIAELLEVFGDRKVE